MLLECKKACIINPQNRPGDPDNFRTYLFCLEIVFILIKANKRVKGINNFERTYLYSAYADDTTFFLKR